ncbi:MAG TPA: (2Fe-2S) ferredoxin domain-containing protein, partial [Candidatus Kapabacteria bacterium]|nr:(2Fe-2S) ferredoxin domain-containing protein [Candidatus Kapabacteria bacterium]
MIKAEKIKSIEELRKIGDAVRNENLKIGNEIADKILVCAGGGCIASGSLMVKAAIQKELEEHGIQDKVLLVETGCLGP